ncbi:MAG: tyrosine recombinase XerC [Candidatus Xenolissoclinum pacificiensis L6]|uniref:Tyrosine recombinase XerC n=1 Tax=Candidatus Xenolissoclinum pacificiensis L6 TaxID=1401685 RepID=W2UZF8_9RICK|nr:MAG: tyrosine recombinase XerC [Candidatus Xenolissoclinum pacificiensis L6]
MNNDMLDYQLRNILKKWLLYLVNVKNYSINTYDAYKVDVESFLTFYYNTKSVPLSCDILSNIKKGDLRAWISKKKLGNAYSPVSIRRSLSAVKTFYRYLAERYEVKEDVVVSFSLVTKTKSLPKSVNLQDIEILLSSVNDKLEWVKIRNQLIILIMYGCGLRISEVLSLTLSDFQGDNIKVLGKGSKYRVIPVFPQIRSLVNKYVDLCPMLSDNSMNTKIFINLQGAPLSRNSFANYIARIRREQGLPEYVTSHAFRHSFATHLLESGAQIRFIQEALGHADLSVTERYTQVSKTNLLLLLRNAHPSNRK